MPRNKNQSRNAGRPKQRKPRRSKFDQVTSSGVFRILLDNQNLPNIIPLQRLAQGNLDQNRAFRLKSITLTALPVNIPGGHSGVVRVGQKGERWAFNGPQNFLELGKIIPSITNPTTRTFRPYGPGAGVFIEQPSKDDFQLEFLTAGCTYTPQLAVTLSIQFTAHWELEHPECQDFGSATVVAPS